MTNLKERANAASREVATAYEQIHYLDNELGALRGDPVTPADRIDALAAAVLALSGIVNELASRASQP